MRAIAADPWRQVRWSAMAAWAIVLAAWIWTRGVPFDRTGLMLWIAAGLIAASIGRRALWTVLLDWLPFALVLIGYDFARGAAPHLNGRTLWTPQITVDRWLGDGIVPTVWLQQHLKDATARWWDAVVALIYVSFFLLPYVLAGVLWLRSRHEFYRWVVRYVSLCALALVTFILFPAAPPWAAARCSAAQVSGHPAQPNCVLANPGPLPSGGLLGRFVPTHPGATGYVERISGRGFSRLHIPIARRVLDEGQRTVDLVAAIPSLHAGVSLLAVLLLWPRMTQWWRFVGAAYVVAMAFTLVYSGEHYVVDILIGWAMAGLVMVAWRYSDTYSDTYPRRFNSRLRQPASVMENQCPPIETTPSSVSANDAASSTPLARSTAAPDPPGTTARSASS